MIQHSGGREPRGGSSGEAMHQEAVRGGTPAFDQRKGSLSVALWVSECVDKVVYVGGCGERFSGELVLVVTASS